MNNVLIENPFIVENHRAEKPLYAALVPDEIFKGSHFERRFVTPFGGTWEKLALAAAQIHMKHAALGYPIFGLVKTERLRRISEVLNRLEHPERGKARTQPNWNAELDFVLQGDGEDIPVQVMSDLYCEDHDGRTYAFELKTPLPNSDITKVSKEKLLKLHAMEPRPVTAAYFALPYNPYRRRELYTWSFPARWLNMRSDPVVLMGDEFWNLIGGAGTYAVFIDAINEIGVEYKDRIYRDFLGIEPPDTAFEGKL